MVNDKNLINKLTKGFKLKINKKKKSNWRTLNSRDSLPPTPSDDLMLYSDTEAELYQAKINVEANRSFVSYNNNNSFNNESNFNTNNILAGLNSNDNFVGRSKTTYTRPTTNTYTYNSTINAYNNNNINHAQSLQTQNKLLYPNSIAENRKNSFQTITGTSPNKNSQPIPINKTSSSNNSTPYTSAPNSPLSFDSSDTYVNDLKINPNNPFITNINTTTSSNINPKATTTQINTHLNITTSNMDPALSHSLISPIEFDGSGKEIKSKSNTNVTFDVNNSNNNIAKNLDTTNNNNNTPSKDLPSKSKSIKKIKPLITFDTPPVVSPMAPGSDSDETGHRRRGGKKSKKYSKKRSSPSYSPDMNEVKKSGSINGSSNLSKSSTVKRLNKPNEEDDDVPLGIIQYKCLSSLLQESAPQNISSLQSNKKAYKSSHLKDNYGYISPSEYCSKEKYDIPKFTNYSNYYHENYVI